MKRYWVWTAALVWGGAAMAQQAAAVSVQAAWARATPPGATTAVIYFSAMSARGDTLTGASTPSAQTAGLHQELMNGDVMRMRPMPGGLALPAGQTVMLRPGGVHLMLDGLKTPLVQGGTVKLHLTFAKSAPVDLAVPVLPIGSAGPGESAASMPGMEMGH